MKSAKKGISELVSTPLANGLDVARIAPSVHEKFSPFLHAWLTSRKHRRYLADWRVYECAEGHLWIGWRDDHGFLIGTRLYSILCKGARQESMAYAPALRLVEVPDFWQRYMESGRCAIDPEHAVPFTNSKDRFLVNGDHRTCQWCGHQQVLRRWNEIVERTRWQDLSYPLPQ